jgi:hypothetical protein
VKDADGTTHGYLIFVDEGTDWTVAKFVSDGKTAEALYDLVETGWLEWAGPPDVRVADGEKGFAAESFSSKLGRAGTLYLPSAGFAPWQKGKVERKIQSQDSIL